MKMKYIYIYKSVGIIMIFKAFTYVKDMNIQIHLTLKIIIIAPKITIMLFYIYAEYF